MVKGIDRYSDKEKRKVRRRNHIARDLQKAQFRQKIKEGKPKRPAPEADEWEEDIDRN